MKITNRPKSNILTVGQTAITYSITVGLPDSSLCSSLKARNQIIKHRDRVAINPALYPGGPGLKSLPGDQLS
jgi:hypothetical protein